MPENSPRGARLDHVSEAGDLVFEAGGERFIVTVDDALERAILAAKQIRAESLKLRQPRANDALPISKIQQLIRAGADPAKVAQRYGLEQALVRRFSASVQMEKQYAIEQFKRVPAPKESRVRTVEDLIYMTLSLARVDRSTLSWQATRRGHEPWRISATFLAAGRKVRAEWTWDMHDNTVVCLNPAAKKLLGEQNLGIEDRRPGLTPIIEGMASRPGGAGDADFPRPAAAGAEASAVPDAAGTGGDGAENERAAGDGPSPDSPASTASAEAPGATAPEASPASPIAGREPGPDSAQPATMGDIPAIHVPPAASADAAPSDGAAGDLPPVPDPDGANAAGAAQGQEERRRRPRRSAIPSWDQILFGE